MFLLIILNILINAALIMTIILFGTGFMGNTHPPLLRSEKEFFTLVIVITTLITLFSITPIGKYITKLLLNARNLLPSEQEYLTPILNKVTSKIDQNLTIINNKFNIRYIMLSQNNIKNLQIMISDKKIVEYSIIGTNTIILSAGLIKLLPINELEAILAQQILLLMRRNGLVWQLFKFSNFVTFPITWTIKKLMPKEISILKTLKLFMSQKGVLMLIAILGIMLITIPIALQYILCKKLIELIMYFLNKIHIHKADKLAAQCGYKTDLLQFLERQSTLEEKSNNIISLIQAKDPSSINRIKKLQLII